MPEARTAVTTAVCRRCGRTFTDDDSPPLAGEGTGERFDSLADARGAEQPPEAAGWLQGAVPFDAELGTDSGPVEYDDAELCPSCRAEARREAGG
jgi:hypothetical protein